MQDPAAAEKPTAELTTRSRSIALVGWCSFLAASVATMFCFAFLDPLAVHDCEVPDWWSTRLHVYAVGFFFFWLIAVIAAGLAVYMTRTERLVDRSG